MKKYLDWLGYEVRDRVTGFAGVVDSICLDLYGCVMASVLPKHRDDDKERRAGQWIDVKRLEKTGPRVMEPPNFAEPGDEKGPADKAARF